MEEAAEARESREGPAVRGRLVWAGDIRPERDFGEEDEVEVEEGSGWVCAEGLLVAERASQRQGCECERRAVAVETHSSVASRP